MQTQFFLWQLFHIDQELTDAESSVQECREESEAKAVTSAETEEQMKDLTKQIAAIRRQRTSSEKALSKITRKIDSQVRPNCHSPYRRKPCEHNLCRK